MVKKTILFLGLCCMLSVPPTEARETIRIVGSAAVLPFAQIVSDHFTLRKAYPAPSVEITGTGQGIRLFCSGVGFQHPDMIATARSISDEELNTCRANGVNEVTEIVVGIEGLVVANLQSAQQTNFSVAQLYAGLAAKVQQDGRVVDNPYQKWSAIDAALPDVEINVMGPPPTHPAHDAIMALIMKKGCESSPAILNLGDPQQIRACYMMRRDGHYRFGSKNENEMFTWLRRHLNGFIIIPFPLMIQYPGITANAIEGALPMSDTLSSGSYPLTRPIRLYVKTKHVEAIKGLQQFLYEFTSERAISPQGYLVDKGFIPLNDIGRNRARDMALSLETIR